MAVEAALDEVLIRFRALSFGTPRFRGFSREYLAWGTATLLLKKQATR
jgi:hypothetical protein